MDFCLYYQAHVERKTAWLVAGVLRSSEHLVFERTLDKSQSIFEFFVPADLEKYFLQLMKEFEKKNLVSNLVKLENRLMVSF